MQGSVFRIAGDATAPPTTIHFLLRRPRGNSRPRTFIALIAVRIGGVIAGLRLAAVGDLVAGVSIALARNTIDAVRRDALFQLFHIEEYLIFHVASFPFVVEGR